MKWYSREKHSPPCSMILFTYCDVYCWDKLQISFYDEEQQEFYEFEFNELGIIMKKGLTFDVTHFCIPDPIPIEE
jgi:hypothetical protein